MTGEIIPVGEAAAACSRAQTPEAEGPAAACRKLSPGASRPASLTPIGSPAPERPPGGEGPQLADTWSLRDLFGGQERPSSAPPAPPERLALGALSPPSGGDGKDGSPPGAPGAGSASPELPTLHPQPRRLHAGPLVTPLESEASPGPREAGAAPPGRGPPGAGAAGGAAGAPAPEGAAGLLEEAAERRGEAYASTPSPDREGAGGAGWMEAQAESPNPAAAHRSVQSTPEPAHYYGAGVGAGAPISTPSPSATPAGGSCGGQPYLGLPPRFPHGQIPAAGSMQPQSGLLLPPQLPSDFSSSSSVLPPPLPPHASGPLAGSDSVAHAPPQSVNFGAQFRLPLDSSGAGMPAQAPKHGVPAQLQAPPPGHVQAHQQVHLHGIPGLAEMQGLPPGYQQAYQAMLASGWRLPHCPAPLGYPPAHCMDLSLSSLLGSPLGQGAELRGPCPAALGAGAGGPAPLAAGSPLAGRAPASSSNAGAPATPEARLPLPPELSDMRGQVAQLSKTQAGSKYLQRQLLKGQAGVVDVILREVEQDIAQLMCDAYGNYLCSVAFQACSVRQRQRMLEKLAPRVAQIACDKRGTHALQALIGLLSTPPEQEQLMAAIGTHVLELCMDPNGTHVVQRLLYCFVPPCTDAVYNPVVSRLAEVAHHPYGLCVLKKCISQARAHGRHQELLLARLAEHALDLVQSPYGNYAVQHALEEWGGARCTPIFRSLEGRMMQLSIQKFSSNVVEKLFCAAPVEFRARFISELIESEKMSVLVNSNYGHYVVKRALQLAEPQQVRSLLEAIHGNIEQLPNRRLRAKWEKVISAGSERLGAPCAGAPAAADH